MIILFALPMLSFAICIGFIHIIMLESVAIQSEWVTLVQNKLLEKSIEVAFHSSRHELPVSMSCNDPLPNDVRVINGEGMDVWVYMCKENQKIQYKLNKK